MFGLKICHLAALLWKSSRRETCKLSNIFFTPFT
jgi:hypothetical protein